MLLAVFVFVQMLTLAKPFMPHCSPGWQLFTRTPSSANRFTKYWCLQVVGQPESIEINAAAEVCQEVGGVLSAFENYGEQSVILANISALIPSYGVHTGSIAVDGRRIEQCNTFDKEILGNPPCNDSKKVFVMDDKHTDPSYMLSQFSQGEPSAHYWTEPNVESCLQMLYLPNPNSGKINDFFCDQVVSPSNPSGTMYRNYGALCGRSALFDK